jgi:hypothetical protein
MPTERIFVIGKTAPEWSKKRKQLLVCTVGITANFEWRRFHPIFIEDIDNLHNFSWVDVKVSTRRLPDPRPESRRVSKGPDRIKLIRQVTNPSVRKWYIEKCVQPSVESMKRDCKTLGIVKPIIHSVEIVPIEKKVEKDPQLSLTLWASTPHIARQVSQERWKKDYAKKEFEVRFEFTCGEECEHKHNMRVLDIELFMLYQNLYRRWENAEIVFEKMHQAIEEEHKTKDIYLGLGTHLRYPVFMIGSIMRFKKGLPMTRPLAVNS